MFGWSLNAKRTAPGISWEQSFLGPGFRGLPNDCKKRADAGSRNPFSEPARYQIRQYDKSDNAEQYDADPVPVPNLERKDQRRPDAARADQAKRRGRADVDFEAVQRIRKKLRDHLRQHRVTKDLKAVGARGDQRFLRPAVDVFDRFRIQLAEHAHRVDAQREDSRQRSRVRPL